jgi:hypothetical protein
MDVPAHLLDGLNPEEAQIVQAWWLKVPEINQSELAALCDRRRESCFFEPPDGSDAVVVPDVMGGRFVSDDDTRGWSEWRAELFDYFVCHPAFAEPQVVRIFHIGCARHLASMAWSEAMLAQHDMTCPFGSKSCPIPLFKSGRIKRD